MNIGVHVPFSLKGHIVMKLEKEMATYSNILAWKIPWTEEPGGQRSMGSQRIRHSLATNTYRRNEIMMNRKQQKIENRQIDKNNSH